MKKGKLIALLVSVFIALLTMLGIYLHYKLVPYNENRVKIGATYMTMNNDFYKVLNNEIDKIVEEKMIFSTHEIQHLMLINKLSKWNCLSKREWILSSLILLMLTVKS